MSKTVDVSIDGQVVPVEILSHAMANQRLTAAPRAAAAGFTSDQGAILCACEKCETCDCALKGHVGVMWDRAAGALVLFCPHGTGPIGAVPIYPEF